MKITKVVIGACAAVLLMSGCMTEELIKHRAADERITLIGNSSFKIELLSAKTMINDEGLLTVDASTLLSRTGYFRWVFCGDPKVTVWYHFTWIDSQGNICPPNQRELVALPGNIIDLHGVAPEEKYINYHLTISLKGPESDKAATQKNKPEVKEQYVKDGKVKPAGRSQAKQIAGPKPQDKPAIKPGVEQSLEGKPAESSKVENTFKEKSAESSKVENTFKEKSAESSKVEKTVKEKPAESSKAENTVKEKSAESSKAENTVKEKSAGSTTKQQKLTEPFN